MPDSLQTPPLLRDVMVDDGISWMRVVTAIVLLGLSLAIGHRTAREPPRHKAVPQPVRERVVAGVELAPLEQTIAAAPLPSSSVPAMVQVAAAQPTRHVEPLRVGERRQIVRTAVRSPGRQVVRPRRHDVAAAASESGTIRGSARTRAQVRREYLRSRDVVAALTGEDSGSAYLTRLAARQRASRLDGTGHRRG